MAAVKSQPGAGTLDGNPEVQSTPFQQPRSPYDLPFQREQSGGLDDDPTESGEPVRNRKSFTNLTGGR